MESMSIIQWVGLAVAASGLAEMFFLPNFLLSRMPAQPGESAEAKSKRESNLRMVFTISGITAIAIGLAMASGWFAKYFIAQ